MGAIFKTFHCFSHHHHSLPHASKQRLNLPISGLLLLHEQSRDECFLLSSSFFHSRNLRFFLLLILWTLQGNSDAVLLHLSTVPIRFLFWF
ncbi:unnamed protein product [Citrullus colocynthis]|uniref:Uncharacterized protein n=1 Tax=Citrullus colocynthis TaxID=252529 RepID=A0ABP0YFN5_9ROSI